MKLRDLIASALPLRGRWLCCFVIVVALAASVLAAPVVTRYEPGACLGTRCSLWELIAGDWRTTVQGGDRGPNHR